MKSIEEKGKAMKTHTMQQLNTLEAKVWAEATAGDKLTAQFAAGIGAEWVAPAKKKQFEELVKKVHGLANKVTKQQTLCEQAAEKRFLTDEFKKIMQKFDDEGATWQEVKATMKRIMKQS